MVNVQHCCEFELQSRVYVHIHTSGIGITMNFIPPPRYELNSTPSVLQGIDLATNNPQRLIFSKQRKQIKNLDDELRKDSKDRTEIKIQCGKKKNKYNTEEIR